VGVQRLDETDRWSGLAALRRVRRRPHPSDEWMRTVVKFDDWSAKYVVFYPLGSGLAASKPGDESTLRRAR
jgi:hypothetical protein